MGMTKTKYYDCRYHISGGRLSVCLDQTIRLTIHATDTTGKKIKAKVSGKSRDLSTVDMMWIRVRLLHWVGNIFGMNHGHKYSGDT